MRYALIIYRSKVDGNFIVEVPAILGPMADDTTWEDSIANLP